MSHFTVMVIGENPEDQLELFVARVDELRDTRLLLKGFHTGFTINWNKISGMQFISRQPDEEDLRSFLLTFRQFVSDKEPVFLNRIYNMSQQYLCELTFRDFLRKSREFWKKSQKNSGMTLISNGKELTPEYVTDLWINGFYFHSDINKINILKRQIPTERILTKQQFYNFITDATRSVLYVGNLVKCSLREGLFLFTYGAICRTKL